MTQLKGAWPKIVCANARAVCKTNYPFYNPGSAPVQLANGKILKFSYYKLKAKVSQQYRGSVAKVTSTENVGVLCSWYSQVEERVYTFSSPEMERIVHSYIIIFMYVDKWMFSKCLCQRVGGGVRGV